MADSHTRHWHPTAAYLYVLHLDGPALAWEYLRRHPDYRQDWVCRPQRPDAAQHWGLRLLEDPALDARDAHPIWFPDAQGVHLYPDADPMPEATLFTLWRIPGDKSLMHDGVRLVLRVRWPGGCLRLALAPGLADGMAYVYAMRAGADLLAHAQALTLEMSKLALASNAIPIAVVRPRPALSALQELHTLQALDATLAGASLRDIAEGLFGPKTVVRDWHADGALRARMRRLVRRGDTLMRGGYRRLAQLPAPVQGRSSPPAKRP
ncbi:DUF7011 domain-containing protein [Eoetvoesiella caeni]|uniref:DUF2285 domain-containing protein n=1 Tax=Eoetvoesiella caeni TaxID=645616 RepID=A0A366H3W1_9BURK|nr:DUF2285 domain-containing protein [Eoetvoesiella caeni]MCI2810678.1 DUF2285 domain-containing protein [Eoetvoesiella caeni]NYT55688.1 DUF2285 domain-containing protein [Eoetvoesiella caeni]RBP36538.1 hypothetical protein DFR37_112117 [Eoetvoesiella caeni]